jgi:ketosteroid isomerase-like protein
VGSEVGIDNVAIVRDIFARWARRDPAIEHFDPQVEWSTPHPGGQVRGAARVQAFLLDFVSIWSEHELELEEIRAIDEERVLVLFTERARGASSGIETVIRPAGIWTFRAGKVVRYEGLADREEILKRLGPG